MKRLIDLWAKAGWAGRGVDKPSHVMLSLQKILPDNQVIPPLFDDVNQVSLDEAVDSVNNRFGRGAVMAVAAMQAKAALNHGRIPFGRPTEYR